MLFIANIHVKPMCLLLRLNKTGEKKRMLVKIRLHKIAEKMENIFPIPREYRLHLCQRMVKHIEKKINNNMFEFTCDMFSLRVQRTERQNDTVNRKQKRINEKSFLAQNRWLNCKFPKMYYYSTHRWQELTDEGTEMRDTKPKQIDIKKK